MDRYSVYMAADKNRRGRERGLEEGNNRFLMLLSHYVIVILRLS